MSVRTKKKVPVIPFTSKWIKYALLLRFDSVMDLVPCLISNQGRELDLFHFVNNKNKNRKKNPRTLHFDAYLNYFYLQ